MFVEIEQVISDIRKTVLGVKTLVDVAGDYFTALGLVESYQDLIVFASERTENHPEVQRVPELRDVLLHHLLTNADRHIDVRTNRIFNPLILGGPRSLRDWQDAGYHTRRSTSNYPARLRYWKAIYDEAPIIAAKRIGTTLDIFGGAIYSAKLRQAGKARKDENNKTIRNEQGKAVVDPIHYEDVIHARIANYSASDALVPWWEVLNYGSTFAGQSGYPNTPGLHFVEDAEAGVSANITKYSRLFDEFVADVFDQDITGYSVATVENWIKSRVGNIDRVLPAMEVARIVSLGVPF